MSWCGYNKPKTIRRVLKSEIAILINSDFVFCEQEKNYTREDVQILLPPS